MAVSAQVPPTVRLVLVHGTRVSGVQWEVHRRWLSPTFDVATPEFWQGAYDALAAMLAELEAL